MIATYPELFPVEIAEGYELHDTLPLSRKLPEVRFRRIKLKARNSAGKQTVLTIASSAVMPFMTGLTQEVEKALFLRQFAVSFWALTYVFGRDDSYWYRMTAGFGRLEIVSTTVKDIESALFLVAQGVEVVAQGKRRWVDPHWFRGVSYLKIGWAWVKKALRRHWPLLTYLVLPGEPDPEPAIASRKQLMSYRGPCFSVEFLR